MRTHCPALIIVCAPIAQPVDFIIADLDINNTLENQQAITSALQDLFRREAAPGKKMHSSAWERAMGSISTLSQYNITAPTSTIIPQSAGHLPILGKISFQT